MAQHYLSTLIVGAGQSDRDSKVAELTADIRFQITPFDCRDKKSIGDVRALVRQLVFKPSIEKRAVVIILEAHLLSEDAQSTLLKVIEEPPLGFALYLTAERTDQLLPTIVSRCQTVDLGRIRRDESKIAAFLANPLSTQFEHVDEITLDDLIVSLSGQLDSHPGNTYPTDLVEKLLDLKKKTSQTPINKKLAKEYILVELSYR